MRSDFTRRHFGALLALSAFASRPAWATSSIERPAHRVIALDWGVAETLVALGHPPMGAAEIANYDRSVVTPKMPASVIDVGLRLAPNPELMQSLKPDLVLINAAQKYMIPSLVAFAPVEIVAIYVDEGDPYHPSREAATMLAAHLGDPPAATRLLAQADDAMAATRARLRNYDGRPLYVIRFVDGRHVSVAGRKSLVQGVFDQLGLRNAWTRDGGGWGIGTLGIEALAETPNARVIYHTPLSDEARRTLSSNPLWLRLPFVQERRVIALPPVWPFGALPSAMRMARLLGDALTKPEAVDG